MNDHVKKNVKGGHTHEEQSPKTAAHVGFTPFLLPLKLQSPQL